MNLSITLRIFTVFTALLSCPLLRAQFVPDVFVQPKPYQGKPYFDDSVTAGIKKVVFLTEEADRNMHNDTSLVNEYNRDGLKSGFTRYEKNRPASVFHYSYQGRKLSRWLEEMPGKKDIHCANYEYDRNGNLISVRGYDILNKDTLSNNRVLYTYDPSGRLTR
jgi:hypothetical protein